MNWIAVKDQLPPIETDVLVRTIRFGNHESFDVAGMFHDEWMSCASEREVRGEVTHWMPLPLSPEMSKSAPVTVPAESTPMLLENAAYCIECHADVPPEKRQAVIDRLLAVSNALSAAPAPAKTANGEDAKDAARYRWLRKPQNANVLYSMVVAGECGRNMDITIDQYLEAEATAQQKKEGE